MNGQHIISPEALRDTTPADITSLYEVSPSWRLQNPAAAATVTTAACSLSAHDS
jgi:hypothetical protein